MQKVLTHRQARRARLLMAGWVLEDGTWRLGRWELPDIKVDQFGGEKWWRWLRKRGDDAIPAAQEPPR
jgi:hypothetical protein